MVIAAAALAVFAVACIEDAEESAASPTVTEGTDGTAPPTPTPIPTEGSPGGTTSVDGGSCADFARAMAEAFPDGTLVEGQGWTKDTLRAADGPTGVIAVFDGNGEMAVMSAGGLDHRGSASTRSIRPRSWCRPRSRWRTANRD